MYVCTRVHMYMNTHVCICVYKDVYVHRCTNVQVCVYVYTCIYVYMCVCVEMYMYRCACISSIYTHTHMHTPTAQMSKLRPREVPYPKLSPSS